MLYTTFIRLCDEAIQYDDCDEFVMSLGWQSWMDTFDDTDGIIKDLGIIFELAGLDFSGLRKRLGYSMFAISSLYCIPLRTIESWSSSAPSSRQPAPYIIDLLRYTVFVKEKEGDDGFINFIEQN